MAAPTVTTRQQWIEEGLQALALGGPDAVRVEVLAKALGVSKGGFYGQFEDRTALLTEMLDAWERRSIDEVLARVERHGGPPGQRIRRAGAWTFSTDLLPVELAVRYWARRDPKVAQRLHRVDNHRMQFLRQQFSRLFTDPVEIEARSTLAFTLAIGQHLMAADHHGLPWQRVLTQANQLIGL